MVGKLCMHWSRRLLFWRPLVISSASVRTHSAAELLVNATKRAVTVDKQTLSSGDVAHIQLEEKLQKAKDVIMQSWTDRRTIQPDELVSCVYLIAVCFIELPLPVWLFIGELLQPLVDSTSAYDAAKILHSVSLIAKHHLNGEAECALGQFQKIISDIKNRFRENPVLVRDLRLRGLDMLITSFGEDMDKANMGVLLAGIVGQFKAQIVEYLPNTALQHFLHCSRWLPENAQVEIVAKVEEHLLTVLPKLTPRGWGMAAECFMVSKHRATKMDMTSYFLENYLKCDFQAQVRLFVYCVQMEAKLSLKQVRCWLENLEPYTAHFKKCNTALLVPFARLLWRYNRAVPGVHVAESLAAYFAENLNSFDPTKHALLAFCLCEVLSFDQCLKLLDYAMNNCKTGDTLLRCLYALSPHSDNTRARALVQKLAADGYHLAVPTGLTLSKVSIICHTLSKWRLSYRHWLSVASDVIVDHVPVLLSQDEGIERLASLVHIMAMLVFLDRTFWNKLVHQLDKHSDWDVLLQNPKSLTKLLRSCLICGHVWERGINQLFGLIHTFIASLGLHERLHVLQIANWFSSSNAFISEAWYPALFEGIWLQGVSHPGAHDNVAKELDSLYGPGKWLTDIVTAEGCLVPFAGLWRGRLLSWKELKQDPFTTLHLPQQGQPSSAKASYSAEQKESSVCVLQTGQLIVHGLQPIALFVVVGRSYLLNEDVLFGQIRANLAQLQNVGWIVETLRVKGHYSKEVLRQRISGALLHAVRQQQKPTHQRQKDNSWQWPKPQDLTKEETKKKKQSVGLVYDIPLLKHTHGSR